MRPSTDVSMLTRTGDLTVVTSEALSRLSRDLGDTWQIVFRDLASVDVRVIDVTTGLASDGAGARLTFGALALVNCGNRGIGNTGIGSS